MSRDSRRHSLGTAPCAESAVYSSPWRRSSFPETPRSNPRCCDGFARRAKKRKKPRPSPTHRPPSRCLRARWSRSPASCRSASPTPPPANTPSRSSQWPPACTAQRERVSAKLVESHTGDLPHRIRSAPNETNMFSNQQRMSLGSSGFRRHRRLDPRVPTRI
jgi:hypothetical protein